MRSIARAGSCVLLVCALNCSAAIQLPKSAPECVQWASGVLRDAFSEKNVAEAQADVKVTFGEAKAPGDEAFSLEKNGATVTIRGGGPVGAMYGLLELAERVHGSASDGPWEKIAAAIQPTRQRPSLAIRADNVFVHVQPFLLNNLVMWREYIDMLARNRFNMLDLHGGYDLNITSFPNLFPLLVSVPEYPNVGNQQEQAKNLADLKTIVSYAKGRGIKVALMNYSAMVMQRWPGGPPRPVVPPDQLADYTAKATAALIRQVPDLYEIGFRVGETGQPASFFKDAYLKGIADANASNLRLYTRSWLTTKEQLEPIAQAAKAGFDIEIKYNGEHLGLPYHAMQRRYGTYSYEHYLDVPANYGIIWQVRANGTHHYWAWENTDFVRRTVRTFQLGNARGFTLEPPIAYYPVEAATYYHSDEDKKTYDFIWQKHWMWYLAWGRLGYDAELPESVIRGAFADHFGSAGEAIYGAMQESSKIVPLVFAYRFVGADQRDYSPETETGYLENARSIVGRRRPVPEGVLQYALNTPEDDRSFVGIDAWVNERIDTMADGRLGPFAVAEVLQKAAESAQEIIARAPAMEGKRAAEWRLLKTDLEAAAWLGRYHAARILGLTYFEHAWKINDAAEYEKATQLLTQSREAWKALAQTVDSVYAPVNNPLRGQRQFEWKSLIEPLEKIDSQAAGLWAERPRGGAREPSGARAGPIQLLDTDHPGNDGLNVERMDHVIARSKRSVSLTCKASATAGLSRVVLWWKPLPSSDFWRSQDMVLGDNGAYATTVPLTSEGLMYMVELQDSRGDARNFPPVLQETPYRIIPPFAE